MASGPPRGLYELYKRPDIKFQDWLKETYQNTGRKWHSSLSLRDQATEIVITRPRIDIPRHVLDDGNSAIQGRQKSVDWHRALRPDLKADNESHAAFIDKLRPALEVLEKAFKDHNTEPETPECNFRALQISDDQGLVSVGTRTTAGTRILDTKSEDIGVKETAVWARTAESKDVRDFVKDSMHLYQQGKLTLPVLMQTMDAAIHMLQLIDCKWQEFGVPDYEDTIETLGISYRANPTVDVNLTQAREDLCIDAFCSLHWLRQVLQFTLDPNDTSQTSKSSNEIPYPKHEFSHALLAIVHDLKNILYPEPNHKARKTPNKSDIHIMSNVDHYTAGLLRLAFDPVITFAMVSATQLYMTLWDFLNGDTVRGYEEARLHIVSCYDDTNAYHQHEITEVENITTRIRPPNRAVTPVDSVVNIGSMVSRVKGWSIDQHIKNLGFFLPQDVLQLLPTLAIFQARKAMLHTQRCGAEIYDRQFNILACAYLYRATQAITTMPDARDFEVVLSLAKGTPFFARVASKLNGIPLSVRQLAVEFSVNLGIEESSIVPNRKPVLPTTATSRKSVKKWPVMAEHQLYCIGGTDKVGKVEFHQANECTVYRRAINEWMQNHDALWQCPAVYDRWERNDTSAMDLLWILQEIFTKDEVQLNTHHIGFGHDCVRFLNEFIMVQGDSSSLGQGKTQVPRTNGMLYAGAFDILWDAALVAGDSVTGDYADDDPRVWQLAKIANWLALGPLDRGRVNQRNAAIHEEEGGDRILPLPRRPDSLYDSFARRAGRVSVNVANVHRILGYLALRSEIGALARGRGGTNMTPKQVERDLKKGVTYFTQGDLA